MTNRAVRVTDEEYEFLKARRSGHEAELGPKPEKTFSREESENNQVITSISNTVRTLDDALRVSKVDLAIWEVERFVVNKWDNVAKVKRGLGEESLHATELWQVKVWLKRKVSKATEDGVSALMHRMADHAPKYPKIARPKSIPNPHMLEVSICDSHFAKLAWSRETGDNYDLKIAEGLYLAAVENLAAKAAGFNIDKILFPIGNDLFHFDNLQQTTTAGTQQDSDTRYVKMFECGQAAVIKAIDYLLNIAPVQVVQVAGNHDHLSSWHLAHTIKAWYRNCKDVVIDDEPTPRKYIPYGKSLIGYTHGDSIKAQALPNLMATEVPELWAESRFREWHLGHIHIRREFRHLGVDSQDGMVVRYLPSISGRDQWHCKLGYVGIRAADAFLFNREHGLAGYFCANVVGERQVA